MNWRRRSLLLALAGLHLAAFVLWRPVLREAATPQPRITWLQLLAEPKALAKPASRVAAAQVAKAARTVPAAPAVGVSPAPPTPAAIRLLPPASAQAEAAAPSPAGAQPPAASTANSPDYFAITPAAKESALDAAKRVAGAADRQLRKEAWNPRDKVIANAQSSVAARISAAYIGNEGVTYEELTLPDGRHMTKIHAGGSTYCAYMESNGLVGGRDVFKDGVKTKISTCPL